MQSSRLLVIALSTLTCLGAAFSAPNPAAATALELWVSPSGDDSAEGSEATPLRTLERVMETIEQHSAEAEPATEIVVYLTAGIHRLEKTLDFDPEIFGPDGPSVSFLAAPGAQPVISGAQRVEGWALHDAERNIYRAHIRDAYSRQLYVDGQRATRARTERVDGHIPAGFRPHAILPESPDARDYTIGGSIEYVVADQLNPKHWANPADWSRPEDVEAVIETQWKMMIVPVAFVDPPDEGRKTGQILMEQPAWTNANLYLSPKSSAEFGSSGQCQAGPPGIWSFWQVSRFENAYEFIDRAGEWYIDGTEGLLYYKAPRGQTMAGKVVELPALETLVRGRGTDRKPVANLRFEGLTFAHATWLAPIHQDGYVADQSGFRVVGKGHRPTLNGHIRNVVRTPGNLSFRNAWNIVFENNVFEHLGAVGLDFGNGSHDNRILGNRFHDISSAAVQLGDVARTPLSEDGQPTQEPDHPTHNTISNNIIHAVAREYVDAAGIFVGFSSHTDISHNTIDTVPWAGIAMGWGWGLLDASGYPGIACAEPGEWGAYPITPNSHNTIRYNRISNFVQNRWDAGAIYTTGQQGQSMDDALVIEGNLAYHKRRESGGNVFYTDGGSRYIRVIGNASFDNPIGKIDLGPPPRQGNPLPYPDPMPGIPASVLNQVPYGGQIGGCRTFGDIHYGGNYWQMGLGSLFDEFAMDVASAAYDGIQAIFHPDSKNAPLKLYSKHGFFDICPFRYQGADYPVRLTYEGNHLILGEFEIPRALREKAGVKD